MKTSYVVVASVLLVSVLVGNASAATVTFNTAAGAFPSYTESGMTFTPIAPSTVFRISGNAWNSFIDGLDQDWQVTRADGQRFQFQSVDVIHFDSGEDLRFEGFLGAASVGVESISAYPAGGTYNFSTLGGLWYDRVEMTMSAAAWWDDPTLDNLTFEAIPEPSTLILMGLGVMAVGAVARRRRRK